MLDSRVLLRFMLANSPVVPVSAMRPTSARICARGRRSILYYKLYFIENNLATFYTQAACIMRQLLAKAGYLRRSKNPLGLAMGSVNPYEL